MTKQYRLMMMCFGNSGDYKRLDEFFNERKKRRDYESINFVEGIREIKFIEFDIDFDEKKEFIEWLGQHVWLHNHAEMNGVIEMMLSKATGYRRIVDFAQSGSRQNNLRLPVYALFEREFETSI